MPDGRQRAYPDSRKSPEHRGFPPPEHGLAIACFGSFSLYWEGRPVRIPGRKATETLALLFSHRGKPLRKAYVAETLRPEADPSHAMDSLYKACRVLRDLIRQGIPLPLIQSRDTLLLERRGIDSDVERFQQLYQQREDAACRAAAIELYQAPFLLNEYYEWTARLEAYYDIRYLELLQLSTDSAQQAGDTASTAYYQKLLSSVS